MRKIRIRLNGIRDIDLLALKYQRGFSLEDAIYTALRGYLTGMPCTIPVPEKGTGTLVVKNQKPWVFLSLDEEADRQLIAWYEAIPRGRRSVAIKCILRNYLSRPYLDALDIHLQGEGAVWKPKQIMDHAESDRNPLAERSQMPAVEDTKPQEMPQRPQAIPPVPEYRPEPVSEETATDKSFDLFGEDGFVELY